MKCARETLQELTKAPRIEKLVRGSCYGDCGILTSIQDRHMQCIECVN